MTYAYLTDGLDLAQRDDFDKALEQGSQAGEKEKAKREKDAVAEAMKWAR